MAPGKFSRVLAFNQNLISGIILFFTVGIYLAVLGLGAGGGKPASQRVSDISNSALYAVFAVFGFFTGSIMNKLGPQITMTIGVVGYPFYLAGLFYFDRTGGEAFPIIGGVVLGLSAPMLWSVSGYIRWAYATEAEKGKYISIQYFINQVGSVIGSLVAFIIILKGTATDNGSPTPVNIVFIILMCLAFIFTIVGLVKRARVRRADGTAIAIFHSLSYQEEMRGIGRVLKDKRVLAMLPVIFSCELALAIIPSINAHYFNLRTRAMSNVMFYLIQLPGAALVAYLTDKLPYDRRKRGLLALSFLGTIAIAGWIALLAWVSTSETFANPPALGVDWIDSKFAGPFVLYLVFGTFYCSHQLIGMWIMGTFTNEPRMLAIYGGLWKGVAGAGVAVGFGMGAALVSYKAQVAFALAFQFVSIPIMVFLVTRIEMTNYGEEVDVVIPQYAEAAYNVQATVLERDSSIEEAGKMTPQQSIAMKEGGDRR